MEHSGLVRIQAQVGLKKKIHNHNYWRIREVCVCVCVKVIVGVLMGTAFASESFMSTDARVIRCINECDSGASHRCVIV